jgi:hypothetical protein
MRFKKTIQKAGAALSKGIRGRQIHVALPDAQDNVILGLGR